MLRSLLSLTLIFIFFAAATVSCSLPPFGSSAQPPVSNAVFVSANDEEAVWERVVDVLHDYRFEIARENKLDGVIETQYKTGSSLLEPWHLESVGLENRLESTLQSIRRRVFVYIMRPVEIGGGFNVRVEAFKEIEHLPGVAANSAGGATFQESRPLARDLNLVVGQSTPSGWIPLGRDFALEQQLSQHLQAALSH